MTNDKHGGGMVKITTEDGEYEQPLFGNNPQLAKELGELRDRMEEIWGDSGQRLIALREGENGEWLGVFAPKPPKDARDA
jgi:hypothetical protein